MRDKLSGIKSKLVSKDNIIYLILLLLFIERIVVFFALGAEYYSNSDDGAYIQSGIYFAQTGIISIWWEYPSAMAMPGMTVLTGVFAMVFPPDVRLLVALKMFWIFMGVMTAYFSYKTVTIFAPKWCGVLAACCFFTPNIAWMNNIILTETPYALLMIMCLYYTLQMGERDSRFDFAMYIISFMLALMFRANIMTMPVFSAIYLLLKKSIPPKALLKKALILAATVMIFVVPWTIRNYIHFNDFIPITYGAGNPALLGTYQGEGYPKDEDLDYETNVYAVIREKYPEHFEAARELPEPDNRGEFEKKYDPFGDVKEMKWAQFISLKTDGLMAEYRMKEWFSRDPVSFIKSYLFIKPRWMLNWSWAWREVLGVTYEQLHLMSQLNFIFCALTAVLALVVKKGIGPVYFLGFVYFFNVYIHSLAFVSDRYASTIMMIRYIIVGFGYWIASEFLKNIYLKIKRNKKA